MINKNHIKFYLIAGSVFLIVFLIILVVPMRNKKTTDQGVVPTPTLLPSGTLPTRYQAPSPTLIPLRFTGADLTQDIPADIKLLSQQKTELRRKTPLKLSFGTISFNYETDTFTLTLTEPKNQSQTTFNTWRQQTYPAIPLDQFSIIN